MSIKGVLFDLDGTLLDTAPDLAAALNILLARHQYPTVNYAQIRPHASHGAKALVKLGFKITENDPHFDQLRQEYFNIYSEHSCVETDLFPGIQTVLDTLAVKQLPWGIVTNKPGWLTMPILEKLNLLKHAGCVVCGDTLNKNKPDPAPLLYACELLNLAPKDCIYIGDAEIDMIAGQRAGIPTIFAKYGYISPEDKPANWPIAKSVESPIELLEFIK